MTDNWTPKTGKVIDSWTPKSGSIVSDEVITPEIVEKKPTFYSEIVAPLVHGSSTLALGIPKAVATKTGTKELLYPEQQTFPGKALRFGFETAGFLGGGALKAGKMVAGKIAGQALRKKVARGATELGVAGLLQTPQTEEGKILAPEERVVQGGLGAVLGGLFGLGGAGLENLKNIKKYSSPKAKAGLSDEVRNSLQSIKRKTIEKFGINRQSILEKAGDRKIDITEPITNLMDNADDAVNLLSTQEDFAFALSKNQPHAGRILNLVKTFNKADPKTIENLSVNDADKISQFVKNMPGIRAKLQRAYKAGFEQVDWTNSERILLEFADDVQDQVLKAAPDIVPLKAEYGKVMTNLKRIRPLFRWGKSEETMKNLHKLPADVSQTILETMPEGIINKMKDFNSADKFGNLLKRLGIGLGIAGATAGGGYLGGTIAKKAISH